MSSNVLSQRPVETPSTRIRNSLVEDDSSHSAHSPLSQTFKLSLVCAVLGHLFMFLSVIGSQWISLTVTHDGKTFTAIVAGLWRYCIEVPDHVPSVYQNGCFGLTFFSQGMKVFETAQEGLYPQVSCLCYLIGNLAGWIAFWPLFRSVHTRGYEHYWAGAFFTASASYNSVALFAYAYGVSKYLVAIHLSQADFVQTRVMWGIYIFALSVVLFIVPGCLLMCQASVYMRRGRDSLGVSIFSTSSTARPNRTGPRDSHQPFVSPLSKHDVGRDSEAYG